ncbi:MAG TPA: hypothetical protein VM305_05095 [Candidatus Limnocylindrales bacterium]|nr:hypothetical protein [Candidatus Limnocylindrales bacterium]
MTARLDRLRRMLTPRHALPTPGDAVEEDGAGEQQAERSGGAPDDRRGDRFAGAIAVVIAVATLLAAVAGLLQAEAAELAEDDRLAATRSALEAAASAQRGQQLAQVEYQSYIAAVEQATSAGNAQLRSMLADEGSGRHRQLLLEHERWQRLAEVSLAGSEIGRSEEYGPEQDPTFPRRYFAAAREESHRLNALQDAYNERANQIDERGAAYTAILAVLAVSVYLYVLSVAVSAAMLRRSFVAVASLMLAVAACWMGLTALQTAPDIREDAAAAYAAGRVASETAHDSAGYADARRHFDRAIELRPSFGPAYLGRADAIFLGASQQRGGLVSLVPVDALRAARADTTRARELGLATAQVEGRLGFYAFAEGIQTGDMSALEASLAATTRALRLDPAEPVYWLNLGLVHLALERPTDAQAAYTDAAKHALYVDGDRHQPRNEPWLEQTWLAGALTDLELLARHRPHLSGLVDGTKEWLVGRIGAGTMDQPEQSDARIEDVVVTIFPGQVQWQAQIPGYQPERDVISAQWYHRLPGAEGWAVMPEVSGRSGIAADPAGGYFQLSRYLGLTQPAACMPPGSYRLELYLNGQRVASQEVEPDFGVLEAALARDITMAYCRPADWQPIEEQVPGLLHGFTATDGYTGVYGLRFDLPRSFSEVPGLPELMLGSMMGSMTDLFPAVPVLVEEAGTTDGYFMGLSQTAWQWYDYGSGWVRAAAGLDEDGAVLIGIVYGPYAWFDSPVADAIHDSMVRHE